LPVASQFTYTTNNGTITITGYAGTNNDVVIPSTIDGLPVTSIGTNAFLNAYYTVTSVTVTDSVTNIGDGAFSGCGMLTNVTMGNGVTSIGDGVFYECTSLTSVMIPNSVTSIGNAAFDNCTGLTSVYFQGNAGG
jgi:hypothetical protein